jgi:predicted PurR-regulated permease PerM
VLAGLALVGLLLLARVIQPFASALLFAAVLAGILHPALDRLGKALGGRREVAAALLTLAVAVLLVLTAAVLTISLARQVTEGVAYVRQTVESGGFAALVADLPSPLRALGERFLALLGASQAQLEEMAQRQGGRAAMAVSGFLLATWSALFQVAMMLVALFFLLLDGPRLVTWIAGTSPVPSQWTLEILSSFRKVSLAVFVSSLATAGIQTLVALPGYLLAGVAQPVFFAGVTFLAAFVPVIGAAGAVWGVAALQLLTGHSGSGAFLALWGLVVSLTDNVVKPLLLKGRMEVHGAVVFFALCGGIAAFGPAGLVAGPLILSFFLAVIRVWERERGRPT